MKNTIDKFLQSGSYSKTTKEIEINGETMTVIDCENYQIGDKFLKRTYTYFEGGQSVEDETNLQEEDWLGLEQSLYTSALFAKGLLSQGNGFALLLAVLGNGKRGESSENALHTAISVTLQGLSGSNALTAEEITALNTILTENNFTIQF